MGRGILSERRKAITILAHRRLAVEGARVNPRREYFRRNLLTHLKGSVI
jgi:hypothetical protein